jgi:hypothetical protein
MKTERIIYREGAGCLYWTYVLQKRWWWFPFWTTYGKTHKVDEAREFLNVRETVLYEL